MRWPLLLLASSLLLPAADAIVINEIMPNPDDSCSDCTEWVELYSSQSVNLTNWTLDAGGKNVSLDGAIIFDYLIITDDKSAFLNLWPINSSKVIEGTMSLNNAGDTVKLYNNSSLVDNITYPSFSSKENISWSRCESFQETEGTPAAANSCEPETEGCDLSLLINTTEIIYRSGEEIEYKLKVTDLNCQHLEHDYSIRYWIKDLFGDYLREPHTSTYSLTCSDTTSHQKKAPEICGSEAYFIEAQIIDAGCEDSNPENDFAQQLIAVKGKNPSSSSCKSSSSKETTSSTGTTSTNYFIIELLEAPLNATTGQTIAIKVRITNNYNTAKTFDVYSYAYEGLNLITEGGWVGNKQSISIAAFTSATLELSNTIKTDAQPGNYTLKARTKLDEQKIDATQGIEIFAGNTTELIQTEVEESQTQEPEQEHIMHPKSKEVTQEEIDFEAIGEVIWSAKTNRNINAAIVLFIAVLLILVLALIKAK